MRLLSKRLAVGAAMNIIIRDVQGKGRIRRQEAQCAT